MAIWVFLDASMSKKYPSLEWGAGNDPEASGLAFRQGPTFINAYCQAATNLVDRYWGLIGQTDIPSYSGQYVGNDLSRPRRSALSECFV